MPLTTNTDTLAKASGTITAASQSIELDCSNRLGTLMLNVTSTSFTAGNLSFQGFDGVKWGEAYGFNINVPMGSPRNGIVFGDPDLPATGQWMISCTGFTKFRIFASPSFVGNMQISMCATESASIIGTILDFVFVKMSDPLPAGTNAIGKVIARSGAKGVTVSADVTSTSVDANTQGLDVSVKGTVAVSGPLTDTQIRATALPVSGAFFQATQPVSAASLPLPGGASTSAAQTDGTQKAIARGGAKGTTVAADVTSEAVDVNTQAIHTFVKNTSIAVTGPLTDAQIRATPLPVSGTVTATGPLTNTQLRATPVPVSGTVTANLAAGVNNIGDVDVLTLPALPAGANSIGTVQAPTITKGTQGATGFSVQRLQDAGRNLTNFFMATQIASTATDALVSLTGYKSGAAVVATTTPAVVTAGKTFRMTSLTLTYVTIVTTPGAIRFTLRANTAGVVAIGSPAVSTWTVGEPSGAAPVAGKFNTVQINLPEGLEFAAGTGIGISQVGISATGVAAVVGAGIAVINGFEY